MAISSVTPLLPEASPTTPSAAPINLARCVREVYVLMLASLRDGKRTIEVWREIEDRRLDEVTSEKARTYRSLIPQIIRAASMAFGVMGIGSALIPKESSLSWITPLGKGMETARDILKQGIELHGGYQSANIVEFDAQIEKFRRITDQMSKESQNRRKESDEVLRLIQDIDGQIAKAIAAIARQ